MRNIERIFIHCTAGSQKQTVYDQDGVRLPDKLYQLKNNSGVGKAYVDSGEFNGTGEIFNSYSGMSGENTAVGQYSHA